MPRALPLQATKATNCGRKFLRTDGPYPGLYEGLWTISFHPRRKSVEFVCFRPMEMKYSDLYVSYFRFWKRNGSELSIKHFHLSSSQSQLLL